MPALAGAVVGLPDGAGEARRGSDVDDAPGAVGSAGAAAPPGCSEGAHQVDVDDAAGSSPPTGRRTSRARCAPALLTRMCSTSAAQLGGALAAASVGRRRVAHVEDERLRDTACGGDRFRRLPPRRPCRCRSPAPRPRPRRRRGRPPSPTPLPAPVTSAERPSSRKTSRCRASVAPRQAEHVLTPGSSGPSPG